MAECSSEKVKFQEILENWKLICVVIFTSFFKFDLLRLKKCEVNNSVFACAHASEVNFILKKNNFSMKIYIQHVFLFFGSTFDVWLTI